MQKKCNVGTSSTFFCYGCPRPNCYFWQCWNWLYPFYCYVGIDSTQSVAVGIDSTQSDAVGIDSTQQLTVFFGCWNKLYPISDRFCLSSTKNDIGGSNIFFTWSMEIRFIYGKRCMNISKHFPVFLKMSLQIRAYIQHLWYS